MNCWRPIQTIKICKAWRTRAKAIQDKLIRISNGTSFTSRCMWNEHSYREAFVGIHCGDIGAASGRLGPGTRLLQHGQRQKLEFLNKRIKSGEHVEGLARRETVAWIQEQYPVALQKEEAARKKR